MTKEEVKTRLLSILDSLEGDEDSKRAQLGRLGAHGGGCLIERLYDCKDSTELTEARYNEIALIVGTSQNIWLPNDRFVTREIDFATMRRDIAAI